MATFPARLHVVSARDVPISVIFRRGPSKKVCTMLWNRRDDSFTMGQWLNGRIHERRSDISPDGKYLIYFAMNGRWDSETKGSWTAISKAPYLKAIALFAKGDCWNGGGLFTGPRTYWLNDGYGHEILRDTREVKRDSKFVPSAHYGGECPSVYYLRLLRDGWTLTTREKIGKWKDQTIFEKHLCGEWLLRKIAHEQVGSPVGKGCYWDEHAIVNGSSGSTITKPDWDWADVDGEAILFVEKGMLYRGTVDRVTGSVSQEVIRDFNGMQFEPIEAPY